MRDLLSEVRVWRIEELDEGGFRVISTEPRGPATTPDFAKPTSGSYGILAVRFEIMCQMAYDPKHQLRRPKVMDWRSASLMQDEDESESDNGPVSFKASLWM